MIGLDELHTGKAISPGFSPNRISPEMRALLDQDKGKQDVITRNLIQAQAPSASNNLFDEPDAQILGFNPPRAPWSIKFDQDGIVRRTCLFSGEPGRDRALVPSFALAVAQKKLDISAIAIDPEQIRFRERIYPMTAVINFVGPPQTVRSVSLHSLLNPPVGNMKQIAEDIRGKVVLIGSFIGRRLSQGKEYLALGGQFFPTPLSRDGNQMSGVELEANIIANLLSGRCLSEPGSVEICFVLLMMALFFSYLFTVLERNPLGLLLTTGVFSIIWVLWCFLSFLYLDYLIPCASAILGVVFPSLLLLLVNQSLTSNRERLAHTKLFHSVASPAAAESIDRATLSTLGLDGKTADVTVMALKLNGLAERITVLGPESTIGISSNFLSLVSECVYKSGGLLIRQEGNSLLALWGAPLSASRAVQVTNAIACAVEIQEKFEVAFNTGLNSGLWNKTRIRDSQETDAEALVKCFKLRFGVNSGEAVCGRITVGSGETYTVIGEAVDRAEQLVALAESLSGSILVGETSAKVAGNSVELRELVCRRSHQANSGGVYELLGHRGDLGGALEEALQIYRQAVEFYKEGDLKRAMTEIKSALRLLPDDAPSQRMLLHISQLGVEADSSSNLAPEK